MRLVNLALLLGLTLSGCGYRWNQIDSSTSFHPSITVPFIIGDEEGLFTHEVVKAITTSGIADVCRRDANYRLHVSILHTCGEPIGFRKDRQKVDGKIKRNMVACEMRRKAAIEVSLYRGETDELAFGPYQLEADVDFDCVDGDSYQDLTFVDPNGVSQSVLPFSLGQLEPCEAAQEAATHSLYSRLAQKIVDVICWALSKELEAP